MVSTVSHSVNEIVGCLQEIVNRQETGGGHDGGGLSLTQKEYYQNCISQLQTLCENVETAQSAEEREAQVQALLKALAQVYTDERETETQTALKTAQERISAVCETLANTHAELKALTATTEERYQARRDKFEEEARNETKNVEEWQKQNEQDFSSSWYDKKNQWNNERKEDLKKR